MGTLCLIINVMSLSLSIYRPIYIQSYLDFSSTYEFIFSPIILFYVRHSFATRTDNIAHENKM